MGKHRVGCHGFRKIHAVDPGRVQETNGNAEEKDSVKSICFFNSNKAWGGGERWVTDNALAAAERGYAVTVATNAESALADRLEADGRVRVHRQAISNLSLLNPATLSALVRFFKETAPRGVVLSLPNDLKAGGVAAKLAGVPTIIYRRGIALPVRDTALNRYLFGSVITAFMCNSEETKRLALKHNPDLIDPARIVVNYNGVDLPPADAANAAPLYPRDDNAIVLGNAGRLTRQKGQDMLLRAVAELRQRGRNVRLIIAGIGELEAELKDLAGSLGIARHVEFAGFVESMPAFYNSIDTLAHSALWEGFGYVLGRGHGPQETGRRLRRQLQPGTDRTRRDRPARQGRRRDRLHRPTRIPDHQARRPESHGRCRARPGGTGCSPRKRRSSAWSPCCREICSPQGVSDGQGAALHPPGRKAPWTPIARLRREGCAGSERLAAECPEVFATSFVIRHRLIHFVGVLGRRVEKRHLLPQSQPARMRIQKV